MNKEVIIRSLESSLPESIYNLAAALESMSDIDTALLGKDRQAELKKSKQNIMDCIAYLSEKLPKEVSE